MKILQLFLSTVTAVALVMIALQLSKLSKAPEPVINVAAPQIPAPIIEEVIVQVDVPAPEIQTVEVKVPAPVIETVQVNVPRPEFSGRLEVDFPSSIRISSIGGTVDVDHGTVRVTPADLFGFQVRQ